MPAPPAGTRLTSRIENTKLPQIIVQLKLRTYAADLALGQEAKAVHAHALLDTGATKTCVSPQILDKLGCERYGLRQQRHAGGLQNVYQRYVDVMLLDDDRVTFAQFTDVEVIEFNGNPDDQVQVLLGMDLLGRFESIEIRGFEVTFHQNGD
jgi:predicted aspartyl protease